MSAQRGSLAVVVLFLLAGLTQARAEPFGTIYRHSAWSKKGVRVCFGGSAHFELTDFPRILAPTKYRNQVTSDRILSEFPEKYRDTVRKVVETEYSPERTGLHFTGWKDCSESASESDVVIFMSRPDLLTEVEGWASIGENLDVLDLKNKRKRTRSKAFVFLRHPDEPKLLMTPEQLLALVALHEFSHLAGLGHEHARVHVGQRDKNCASRWTPLQPQSLGQNVDFTGAYDPNSVTNYCWMNALTSNGLDYVEEHGYREADEILPPTEIELRDTTLYSATRPSPTTTRYQIRIGLSQQDLHAVRCLYQYSKSKRGKECRYQTQTAAPAVPPNGPGYTPPPNPVPVAP